MISFSSFSVCSKVCLYKYESKASVNLFSNNSCASAVLDLDISDGRRSLIGSLNKHVISREWLSAAQPGRPCPAALSETTCDQRAAPGTVRVPAYALVSFELQRTRTDTRVFHLILAKKSNNSSKYPYFCGIGVKWNIRKMSLIFKGNQNPRR